MRIFSKRTEKKDRVFCFTLIYANRILLRCGRMKNGGIGARKGMGLGEMGTTEHAKENKAFQFVAVKDGENGEEGKASAGDSNQRKSIDRWGYEKINSLRNEE